MMPQTFSQLIVYLIPVLAICVGLFGYIVQTMAVALECRKCGGPVIEGESLCARCRTAGTLAGQTYEEWSAGRTSPVIWRKF